MNVIKTAHGRGRGGELVEEWTICALKGDKKSVAAAMPEFKEACLSIMGKSPGKPYLPAYVTCGFAEFITKIAGCVKPPSIEIKNRAAPGDPPLHIQKKKRKAGDAPAGDADDLPLNKLQKQVLPYSGKKRGPKSKAEKALAAMAAGAADDVPLLFMLPKKPMPVLPKRLPKKDKPPPKPKKLPYPGKKRGPKTKAEKAAMAAAAAAEAEADDEISLHRPRQEEDPVHRQEARAEDQGGEGGHCGGGRRRGRRRHHRGARRQEALHRQEARAEDQG